MSKEYETNERIKIYIDDKFIGYVDPVNVDFNELNTIEIYSETEKEEEN